MKDRHIHTTISCDSSTDEYRVRLYIDHVYQAGSDYFTDDLEDAKSTADHMVNDISYSLENDTITIDHSQTIKDEQRDFELFKDGLSNEFLVLEKEADLGGEIPSESADILIDEPLPQPCEQYPFVTDKLVIINEDKDDFYIALDATAEQFGCKNFEIYKTYQGSIYTSLVLRFPSLVITTGQFIFTLGQNFGHYQASRLVLGGNENG